MRSVALTQRDPVLSLALLKRAMAGDNPLDGLLPLVLEKTFDARLGHSLAAWDEWATANAAAIAAGKPRRRGPAAVGKATAEDDRGSAPELDADRTGQARPAAP